MNNTSGTSSSSTHFPLSLPAADLSGSSIHPGGERAALRPGTAGEPTRSSSASPAHEQEPPHRSVHQMAARVPQPGELEGGSPGSLRGERKTDAGRETKHPGPPRKRHRDEAQEPSSAMASLAAPREPDKKARSQIRIDPEIQAFLERYSTTEAALDAAFALQSPQDDFLERLSQGLRDRIAQSSPDAQAVQAVTRETLLALRRARPPLRSPCRFDDPALAKIESLGGGCTQLLRGLLRERHDSNSPLCTQDLPDIIQGLESRALFRSRADHSSKFGYYVSLLRKAWTDPVKIPAELLAWVAVPSRYPAHIFGTRLTGDQLAARRNDLTLSMLSNVAEGEVFRDHMDFLASQGATLAVAHATSHMASYHPDKASALLRRALERPDPTGDLCGQVAWGMGLHRAMREQRGTYWIEVGQVPSRPFFRFGGRPALMTKDLLTPIQANLVTDLVTMVRDGQGAEIRLIRLGWGLERAIDGNLRFGATLDPVDDSVKGILERYVGDPASPLTPAQRIAFVTGIAGSALARDPEQAPADRLATDDASCRDLIDLGIRLANPLPFVKSLGGIPSTGPEKAWAALGREQQDKLLASAFLAPAGSSLQTWQDTLFKEQNLPQALDVLQLLYGHAKEIPASTFAQAQAFLIDRLETLKLSEESPPKAKAMAGEIFAVLCDLHQRFNQANGCREDPAPPNRPLPPSCDSERAQARALLKIMDEQIEQASAACLPHFIKKLYLDHLLRAHASLEAALRASTLLPASSSLSSSSSS